VHLLPLILFYFGQMSLTSSILVFSVVRKRFFFFNSIAFKMSSLLLSTLPSFCSLIAKDSLVEVP
jgi:hypothetical protein